MLDSPPVLVVARSGFPLKLLRLEVVLPGVPLSELSPNRESPVVFRLLLPPESAAEGAAPPACPPAPAPETSASMAFSAASRSAESTGLSASAAAGLVPISSRCSASSSCSRSVWSLWLPRGCSSPANAILLSFDRVGVLGAALAASCLFFIESEYPSRFLVAIPVALPCTALCESSSLGGLSHADTFLSSQFTFYSFIRIIRNECSFDLSLMSFTIKRGAYSQPPNEESTPTNVNKRFANGDSYKGSWKHHRPDGEGRYNWENGSWYEGAWLNGKQHGVGKYVWPSGAIYQGEWRGGSMHGVGTLTSPGVRNNGYPNLAQTTSFALSSVAVPRYQGSWVADQRTGLGKQIYARGDMYEGLWRENQPEGPGRYMFISGEEYDGEWRGGLMSGQGTFVWSGGERYDGNWKNGKPDGLGVLSMSDGTTYDSQWRAGKRHGVCVYSTPELKNLRRGSIRRSSMLMTPPLPQGNQRQRKASILLPSLSPSASNNALLDPPTNPNQHHHQQQHLQQQRSRRLSSAPIDAWQAFPHHAKEHQAKAGSTFVRVYQNGNIVREWQVPKEEAGSILPHFAANRTGTGIGRLLRSKTGGNGEVSSPVGEAINKGHQAYSIMLALQLGIRYSVTRVTPEPSFRQLDEYDFQQEVKQLFPRGGSEMTAVHSGEEFMWKDYAPMAFRKLREFFEIDAGSYMRSLCSDTALRLLNSPGKSGAVFLLSNDNQYFVKTVKPNEVALLCSMLPRYYHHVSNHPHTLLNKFFGLHRVSLKSGRKVHLVVMANLFNQMQLHQKFDIKGSRLGRTAGTAGMDAKQQAPMILKDLDLDMSFRLEDGWLDRLAYQLKSDCGLLEQCRIMDYSLLLGVHYRNRQTEGQAVSNFSDLCFDDEFNVNFPRLWDRVSKLRLPDDARKALLALLRARLSRNKQRAIDRQQQSVSASDALAMQQGNTRVQLGVNMPAKAMPRNMDRPPEDVVLYFGIIDILQDYNTSKMLEHNLKSLVHDSYSVSVIDPRTYSQRFQSFLMSIFS